MSGGPRFSILAALALGYVALMFLGTHLPLGGEMPVAVAGSGADKLVHALAYAGLAGLLMAAVSVVRPPSMATAACAVLLIAIYGAIDEWTQSWVPTRSGDPWDWAADALGASLGAVVFLIAWRMAGRKRPDSS